jgi:cytochrome P450
MSRLSWAIDTTISLPRRRAAEELLKGVHATLVAETRRQVAAQSDSLIGRLYQELPDDGDRISATAALISVILMMGSDALGGTVTTAVRGLIDPAPRRPPPAQAQWAAAADDALRYSATVDYLIRVANEPVAIDGMTIVPGEIMVISPLAANHDSHEFGEDADMVSATRNHGVGLAFGAGVHVCVGMRMARNIAREVFSGLAAMPRLRLAGPYRPANGIVVRSAESLPIAID